MKTPNKAAQLKKMITRTHLDFICEAHNGMSAKIVQEAGFSGIWASGLTMSASMGVRDNNETSWTQVLEILEFMSDATAIPILVDGDTGYGNFNNLRRLVKKLECRHIAGVCIEDKLFPKTNSFINSEAQALADIDEFCGKIKAGKDTQQDDDFVIVARTEAFIAGLGLGEALRRAECYRNAGADAILVHSKKGNASDIEMFMKEWGNRHPIVVVPTKYYSTPTKRFRELGISLIIWANHLMRSAIASMRNVAMVVKETESLRSVEDRITPVSEIFRLQGAKELEEAETRYLPAKGKECTAIILAAARGAELGKLTAEKPKAMIDVNGEPVLFSLVRKLKQSQVRNVVVVRGYKKETVKGPAIETIDNDNFENTGELYSLFLAADRIRGHCIIAYGDTLFRGHLIQDLLRDDRDISIVVDADVRTHDRIKDLVRCSKPYTNDFFNNQICLEDVVSQKDWKEASGEWTGLMATNEWGSNAVRETLEAMSRRPDFVKLSIPDMLKVLISKTSISVVYTKGGWLDIDDLDDLTATGRVS